MFFVFVLNPSLLKAWLWSNTETCMEWEESNKAHLEKIFCFGCCCCCSISFGWKLICYATLVSNWNCDFKLTDQPETCRWCINDTELATHQRILENTHQTWKTFNWKYEEALFRIRESYVRNWNSFWDSWERFSNKILKDILAENVRIWLTRVGVGDVHFSSRVGANDASNDVNRPPLDSSVGRGGRGGTSPSPPKVKIVFWVFSSYNKT